MSRYPISRELFPFSHFVPPISEKFLKLASSHMNAPKKFLNAKGVSVTKYTATGRDGAAVDYYVITPDALPQQAPCLFYIHGGGFVLKAAGYHYMNCLRYAKEAGCVVVFPDYRLAPSCPFPIFRSRFSMRIVMPFSARSMKKLLTSVLIGIASVSAATVRERPLQPGFA